METNLIVTPIKYHELTRWLAHNRISLDRDSVLQNEIIELEPLQVPFGIEYLYYSNDGIKTETGDAYGDPLTYLLPQDFSKLRVKSQWNRAVLLMLQNLPPETPIVLWWH